MWFERVNRIFLSSIICVAGMQGSAHAYYPTLKEQCTSLDLRETFPLKVRNQGNISWCYAHTAADYLQYVYKLPEQISAADIAIQYNLRLWPRLLRFLQGNEVPQTGFIRSALRDELASGYCLEKYLPSEKWTKKILLGKDAGKAERKELIEAIKDLFDLQSWVQAGLYKTTSELPFIYDFPAIDQETFLDLLKHTKKQKLLNELRLAACEGHRVSFPFAIHKIGMKIKGPRAFRFINESLDQKMPVAIDYFYGVLEDTERFKLSFSELHTSLLYGRRFDEASGQCEYLIKNSYGRFCKGQHYDPRNDCEGGYLWVAEPAMQRAMVSYEFVKDSLKPLPIELDKLENQPTESCDEEKQCDPNSQSEPGAEQV